ncbi:MAG: class I tRNA ligase family protein, partial [Halobacteria archaeon]|nr:class I tRNA ligase family protein [Halobacteria archaeon]
REVFTKQGTLTELAGEYEGMEIDEAKRAITDDLRDEGYLYDEEDVEQSVGCCWRCDTPIEILAEEQWFIEVRQDEILGKAREVEWIPDHAYTRLEEWTESMEWDWVISRQRVFATPFPVWYCDDCGEPKFASRDEIPVDPTEEDPEGVCDDCGSSDFVPENDVMDTWMDSSISALYVGGWGIDKGDDGFEVTQLREQGHDIIRTWAFYTILRTAALEEEIPWEEALINGMVFGDDGNKMSKSRGNFVQPEEVVEEYGADAFRQAMASAGRPGSDIQFQWKEVERASKFLTKTWNIYRFALSDVSKEAYPEYDPDAPPSLRLADRWILTELADVVDEVEEAMDDHRFDLALQKVREFTWNEVADDYVELVKGRLYETDDDSEEYEAVRWTLRTLLESVVTMVSPVAPFFAEEVYSGLRDESVNQADWPEVVVYDDDARRRGEVLADVVASVRRWKSDEGIALNAELDRVEVYTEHEIDRLDASNALNADVVVDDGEPDLEEVPVGVDADMSVIGPKYKDDAGGIVSALESEDPESVAEQKLEGAVEVDVDGETIELTSDAVEVENELRSRGREVDVVETDDATVLIFE